jgi:ABC-type multidrug transport system fused ATPase/permease subunit
MFFTIFEKLTKPEKIKFFWITVFILLLIAFELFSLGLFLPIIKIFFTLEKLTLFQEDFFFNKLSFQNQINFLLIILVVLYVLKNLFNAFLIYYKKKFLSDIEINFSSRVFRYYLNQKYEFFLNTNKPQIIRNLGILSEYILILENFINFFIEILILLLILVMIFLNDFNVGIFITFFSIFFILIVFKFFGKRMRTYGELLNVYQEQLVNNYLDTLGSIKDIILQKKQSYFLKDFKKNISKQAQIIVKNGFLNELPRQIIEILMVLGISSLMIILMNNEKNLEDISITLTFTVALLFRAIPSITRIIYQLSNLSFKIDIVKKVNNLMSSFKIKEIISSKEHIEFNKILRLSGVSFQYNKSKEHKVFDNIEIEIEKNKTTGIVGPSGSGKSTLLDLICCMLQPSSGGVYLDKKKIDERIISSWQDKISYISQKNYLLNGTILQNIAFAETNNDIDMVNMEKINYAIKLSKLDELVSSHKEGINFHIGEDGENISGGQRQRIIIARAIYRGTDIIIMDEATSALDNQTENQIMSDIKSNFHHKKTLIISTHKKEILNFADKIIDISDLK